MGLEANHRLVHPEIRHLCCRVPGRARCQLVAFDKNNVAPAFLGQMVQGRAASDSAANDDDTSVRFHKIASASPSYRQLVDSRAGAKPFFRRDGLKIGEERGRFATCEKLPRGTIATTGISALERADHLAMPRGCQRQLRQDTHDPAQASPEDSRGTNALTRSRMCNSPTGASPSMTR